MGRQPRDVPTGPRQARDQAVPDGIAPVGRDDRNRGGCLAGRPRPRRREGDDDVDRLPHQVGRVGRELVLAVPILSPEVERTDAVAEVSEPQLEGFHGPPGDDPK